MFDIAFVLLLKSTPKRAGRGGSQKCAGVGASLVRGLGLPPYTTYTRTAALGRSGLLKSPLQSSARPILENYGCRWNETWIKVLYEAGGPPDVIELLIQVSSRIFGTQQKLSKIP
jgi:hypothetical protein